MSQKEHVWERERNPSATEKLNWKIKSRSQKPDTQMVKTGKNKK